MGVVVFVDWHGVLVTCDLILTLPTAALQDEFYNQTNTLSVSPNAFGLLNKFFIDAPDAKLVCIADRRADGKDEVLESLYEAHRRLHKVLDMDIYSVPFAIQLHDGHEDSWRTRLGYEYDDPRGRAIDQWLEDFGIPDSYIILDDDADFFSHQKPHLIQTNSSEGLTLKTFNAMKKHFPCDHTANPVPDWN